MADDASVSLRNEYTIQLMKLPKKVRYLPTVKHTPTNTTSTPGTPSRCFLHAHDAYPSLSTPIYSKPALQVRTLPLKRFQEEYAGDIEAALLARVTERLAASETAAAPPSPTAAEGVPAVAKTTRKGRATRLATAPATTTRGRAAHARSVPLISDQCTLPFCAGRLECVQIRAALKHRILVEKCGFECRAAATPAAARNAGMSAPGTVRAPKPGETFYSQTGKSLKRKPYLEMLPPKFLINIASCNDTSTPMNLI